MKKLFLILVLLWSVGALVNAQTSITGSSYIWNKDTRYDLTEIPNKRFIVFEDFSAVRTLLDSLGTAGDSVAILELDREPEFSSGSTHTYYYAIIRGNNLTSLSSKSYVLYDAPHYDYNGEQELCLTSIVDVKLKSNGDLSLLQNLASTHNFSIVNQNPYMPLWYVVSCNKSSSGNALKISNLLYESNLFDKVDMRDLNLKPEGLLIPNDPEVGSQWGMNQASDDDINAFEAWDITTGDPSIEIAVIDEGIYTSHLDLSASGLSGFSYDLEGNGTNVLKYSGTRPFNDANPCQWKDGQGNQLPCSYQADGNRFHGTSIMGVIFAEHNTSYIAGLAPNCKLMPISADLSPSAYPVNNVVPLTGGIYPGGGTTLNEIGTGVNLARVNGASVVNLSLSIPFTPLQVGATQLKDAIDDAHNLGRGGLGMIIVGAAGNVASNIVGFPANYEGVIGVGSINSSGNLDFQSSYLGDGLDVVAPGRNVRTLTPWTNVNLATGVEIFTGTGSTTHSVSGTSVAAPHVSGEAALILSVNPCLSQEDVQHIIKTTSKKLSNYTFTNTTNDPDGTYNSQVGYGLIDAHAAVTEAQNWNFMDISYLVQNINGGNSGEIEIQTKSNRKFYTFSWSHDAALTSHVAPNLSVGTYTVTITHTCSGTSATKTIEIFDIDAGGLSGGDRTCPGFIGPQTVDPDLVYTWSVAGQSISDPNYALFPRNLSHSELAQPFANPMQPTTYILTVSDPATGGSWTDQVFVDVSYDWDNLTVNSNAVWNGGNTIRVRGLINIEEQKKLKIMNMTIEFGPYMSWAETPDLGEPGFGVWVQKGSELELENVTLTGLCGNDRLWRGVEVWSTEHDPCNLNPIDCWHATPTNPGGGNGGGKDHIIVHAPINDQGAIVDDDMLIGLEKDNTGKYVSVYRHELRLKRPQTPVIYTALQSPGIPGTVGGAPSSDFGKVVARNSLIEDAVWGVRAFRTAPFIPNPNITNYGGGIVEAEGTTFRNNNYGLYFGPSKYYQLSKINDCDFIYDKPVNGTDEVGTAIGIVSNSGVQITDNDFVVDETNHTFAPGEKGIGIYSYNATYTVAQKVSDPDPTIITGNGNSFTNFYKGVDAYSSGGLYNVLIKSNTFTDCMMGVTSNGANFDEISRNIFNVPQGLNTNERSYAVFMDGAREYQVSNNIVNSSGNTNGYTFGVVADNTGANFGMLSQNDYNGVFEAATQTKGTNSNIEIDCNHYNDGNVSDLQIGIGMFGDQGICDLTQPVLSVTNSFHIPYGAIGEHIDDNSIGFNYRSPSNYLPTGNNGSVTVIDCGFNTSDPLACPILVESNETAGLRTRKKFKLDINGVGWAEQRQMENEFIRELIRHDKINQAMDILYYREDASSKQALATIMMEHGFYDESRFKIQQIDNTTLENQKTIALINDEVTIFENNNGMLIELTSADENIIRNKILPSASSASNAEALLKGFEKDNYRRYPWKKGQMMMITNNYGSENDDNKEISEVKGIENSTTLIDLKIVPNPFSASTTISVQSDQFSNLIILDMLGKIVKKQALTGSENVQINGKELGDNGIYFVILSTSEGKVLREKIILQH